LASVFILIYFPRVNNPTYSDVTLLIGKRPIYGHYAILSVRCPKLIGVSSRAPKKKKGVLIKELHKDTNEAILLEFLNYIYTEEVSYE
jgi:hypothetical protein